MYLLIILFPFLGANFAGFYGRFLGYKGTTFLTTTLLFLTFCVSFFSFLEVGFLGCVAYVKCLTWVSSDFLQVDWGFLFDSLATLMCCVVTFISFLVHLYSIEYMAHDPHLTRFMSYLSIFTFFMLILVTSDNFLQLFVGWEGVGLSSYLLINFWFTRVQANKAALQAMFLNRIGDFGLIMGVVVIAISFKAIDYATVFSMTPFFLKKSISFLNFRLELITLITIFLFVGAVGKSAQLGLHTWLPAAMEGPTPVSALIHAATMVTAGVFLISRCSPIYEFSQTSLKLVIFIGAATSLFGASSGLVQNDLKRIVAFSTCSQLGYMVFSCGLSNYNIGIFHLANHAFFKALLFLSAGAVIHSINNEQDIRKMGGLKNLLPLSYSTMLSGSLALIGFPFLAGFYSKDLILEGAYGSFKIVGHFSYFLGVFGAICTAFYSTRLIFLTFLTKPNGFKYVIFKSFESFFQIPTALLVLIIPTLFAGYFLKDLFVGLGTCFWLNAIFILPKNLSGLDAEFIPLFYKLFPVIASTLTVLLAYYLYYKKASLLFKLKTSFIGRKIFVFLNRKWFIEKLHNELISQSLFRFGYKVSYKILDRGVFEIIGPTGFAFIFSKTGTSLNNLHTKYLYHHLILMLIILTILLSIYQSILFFSDFFAAKALIVIACALVLYITNNKLSKT